MCALPTLVSIRLSVATSGAVVCDMGLLAFFVFARDRRARSPLGAVAYFDLYTRWTGVMPPSAVT